MKKKSKIRRQRAREHALYLLERKGYRLSDSAPWEDIVRGLVRFGLASPGQTRGDWLRTAKPSGAVPKPQPAADRPAIDYVARDAINRNKAAGSYSSIFKGVSWKKRDRRWCAKISCAGKDRPLGSFTREADAALAYDLAAVDLFGSFAVTNFPIPGSSHALFDGGAP